MYMHPLFPISLYVYLLYKVNLHVSGLCSIFLCVPAKVNWTQWTGTFVHSHIKDLFNKKLELSVTSVEEVIGAKCTPPYFFCLCNNSKVGGKM